MRFTLLYTIIALAFAQCTKDDSRMGMVPGGLLINETISTDGSGSVSFTASAPGANKYVFEFGDGYTDSSATGMVSHQYTKRGTNTYAVTVSAFTATGSKVVKTKLVQVNVVSAIPGLVWSDEFNVNGAPDATKWTFEIGNGDNGWGNSELQYYTNRNSNAVVENGVLKITARKEAFNGFNYTSARLKTQGKFSFTYGRVEARAKLPVGGGTWPAIWMLGSNITSVGWPAAGEIDIMEHKGNEPGRVHSTLHYPGRFGGNPVTNTTNVSNVSSEFHIYKLEWSAQRITMFVDDKIVLDVPNTGSLPFNKDFFLLLNVAMGGTFGGAVDAAFTSSAMEVDYIRVFQL